MITEERFVELIAQNAIIYYIYQDEIEEMLAKDYDYRWFGLETTYQTKEEAEFGLEFSNIQRTETLSFIPYEDLDGSQYSVCFTKKNSLTQSELLVDDRWVSVISWDINYRKKLSKETYIEACKICKKLFLGEDLDEKDN